MNYEKVILIQGALDIEIEYIIANLQDVKTKYIAGYEFYEGQVNHNKIIVSKTLVGAISTTIATCIGIINFHPNIVINQGIAGAYQEDLRIGDIVIGEKCCNINAYKTSTKKKGEGFNPLEWTPNKRALDIQSANPELVETIERGFRIHSKKRIYKGILGSGDASNKEYDRIVWIHEIFHNLCEDMESIGTYTACNKWDIPCIGIRIISNNELISEEINKSIALELQKDLMEIINTI